MENFKEKISGYIEINKKNSKLNKTDVSDVGKLIKTGLAKGCITIDDAINLLLVFHYSVTSTFVNNVFIDFIDEMKADFISRFMSADKIVKNANHYGITRCLIIVNSLLQIGGNDEYIHMLLKFSAKRAYGKGGGQKAGELLMKFCLNDTKSKLFLLDFSTWEETELRNLSVWLNNAISHTKNQEIIGGYLKFLEKYNLTVLNNAGIEENGVQNVESISKVTSHKNNGGTAANSLAKIEQNTVTGNSMSKKESREKIITLVSQLQSEADRVVKEKMKLSDELTELKSKLEQLNKDKEELLEQVSEINNRNNQLEQQNRNNEIKIHDAEKKIAEMNERLEYAYRADKRAENQEVLALKNDIVRQLRLDYEAFKKLSSKDSAQYHMYYEGLVGIVENIFDSLRRKGIIINNE